MKQKLLFLGDLFYDYNFIAEDIERLSCWIKENNFLSIVNLEGGIVQNQSFPISKRGPNLASSLTVITVFKKLNIGLVCLANNHIMDFGKGGLQDTISLLKENNIPYIGAGFSLSEALTPAILDIGDQQVAFLNFGWDLEETVYATDKSAGCAPRDEEIIQKQIQKVKKDCSKVCVCMHWGFEYNRYPLPIDIKLAQHMIDCGAELVIGHHPHCIQPKQIYDDKLIYYSLGNFYFASGRKDYDKIFNEKIPNQSDYGIMVEWDCTTSEFNEYAICFNHDKGESERSKFFDKCILKDISNENYLSNTYIKKVRLNKKNFNPILRGDKKLDGIKIKMLLSFYKVKAIAKLILKRKK